MAYSERMDSFLKAYPALLPAGYEIIRAYGELQKTYDAGGKVLACGNGGSAADCEHIVGELMKGFELKRPLPAETVLKFSSQPHGDKIASSLQGALPAISLVSQSGLISAFANDVDPDLVYAQQVLGYGREGDALLALSTSGNSKNVFYAAETAKALGLTVIAITGSEGGFLSRIADVCINLPADKPKDVQELTLPVYHFLCLALEKYYFDSESII